MKSATTTATVSVGTEDDGLEPVVKHNAHREKHVISEEYVIVAQRGWPMGNAVNATHHVLDNHDAMKKKECAEVFGPAVGSAVGAEHAKSSGPRKYAEGVAEEEEEDYSTTADNVCHS